MRPGESRRRKCSLFSSSINEQRSPSLFALSRIYICVKKERGWRERAAKKSSRQSRIGLFDSGMNGCALPRFRMHIHGCVAFGAGEKNCDGVARSIHDGGNTKQRPGFVRDDVALAIPGIPSA